MQLREAKDQRTIRQPEGQCTKKISGRLIGSLQMATLSCMSCFESWISRMFSPDALLAGLSLGSNGQVPVNKLAWAGSVCLGYLKQGSRSRSCVKLQPFFDLQLLALGGERWFQGPCLCHLSNKVSGQGQPGAKTSRHTMTSRNTNKDLAKLMLKL